MPGEMRVRVWDVEHGACVARKLGTLQTRTLRVLTIAGIGKRLKGLGDAG